MSRVVITAALVGELVPAAAPLLPQPAAIKPTAIANPIGLIDAISNYEIRPRASQPGVDARVRRRELGRLGVLGRGVRTSDRDRAHRLRRRVDSHRGVAFLVTRSEYLA